MSLGTTPEHPGQSLPVLGVGTMSNPSDISQKNRNPESVSPWEARGENWWQQIRRRLRSFTELFGSVFTGCQASHFSQVLHPLHGIWGREVTLTVSKEQVQDHSMKLKNHKSVGPADMHPRIIRKPADVVR